MAFTVHRPDGKDEFGDESVYRFLDNGSLEVVVTNESGARTLIRVFSPQGWLEVTAEPDHESGRAKGTSVPPPRRLY
ncbi:hypothetical protein [Mycobacteroides abscessus]|uniref:hypothetical protein n=1 Tax=Mycobacteroides abscessus TaxID=36809 RepID=UPI0009411DFB|nr:hypothetical protein [Mycobacteroides abscessus]